MITGLFDGFIFQTLLVFRPIYALRLGTSEERAIQYLTVCMLAGIPLQFLIGYLLDRVGAHAVLVLSCAVIAPRFSLSPGSLINRSPLGRFLRCVAEDQALSPRRHGSFHRQKDDGGQVVDDQLKKFYLSPSSPAPAGEGRPCPSRS